MASVIKIKNSGFPGNTPNLDFGELAVNYADKKVFFKSNSNTLVSLQKTDSFSTILANGNLILASSPSDILTINPGSGISISACTITKSVTLSASGFSESFDQANLAFAQANAAYIAANNNSNPVININNDTSGDIVLYPVLSSNISILKANTSDLKLYYQPNTGTLSATIFSSLSDEELKENIEDIKNPIKILKKLNPVKFEWKDSGKSSFGLIAQEVEKIIPEIVNTNEYKSIEYQSLIPFLIKALQEQEQEIKKMRKRISKLEKKK